MFCKFKENLRAGVTQKDQGHIFSEKINFFKRKMRGLFFFVKNWFDHVTTRLDFQQSAALRDVEIEESEFCQEIEREREGERGEGGVQRKFC